MADLKLLVLLSVLTLKQITCTSKGCSTEVLSAYDKESNGTFHSPGWPNDYENDLICLYKFVGRPNEKVLITFSQFKIRGFYPGCTSDYLNIYINVPSIIRDDQIIDLDPLGRYCGQWVRRLPSTIISMNNVVILLFHSDQSRVASGFHGTYKFIGAGPYKMGTPAPVLNRCRYTIRSGQRPVGHIMSPTYPGVYPNNVQCQYILLGRPGQRVKLTFLDVDMFSGGRHCPYDSIRMYEGDGDQYTEDGMIGPFCKSDSRPFSVYSKAESIRVIFTTKGRRPLVRIKPYQLKDYFLETDRRGFKASYEFSDRFVNLDGFVEEGAVRVKGTDCDLRILSSGTSSGYFASPNYPQPPPANTTCYFYLDGLVDFNNLEKVRITFQDFDMKTDNSASCTNGLVQTYGQGELPSRYVTADHILCGNQTGLAVTSNHPRLLVVLSTGHEDTENRGFKARYEFITDFAIPGVPTNDSVCHFVYDAARRGAINSPRFPHTYPSNTLCIFEIVSTIEGGLVRVVFQDFDLQGGTPGCTADFIEIYTIYEDLRGRFERLVGRYCGGAKSKPGPVMSEEDAVGLKLVFRSDGVISKMGFKAHFVVVRREFDEDKEMKDCRRTIVASDTEPGGMILSPQYPNKYSTDADCEWIITAQTSQRKILLHFLVFKIEPDEIEEGCGQAVFNVYLSQQLKPDYQWCGIHMNKEITSTSSFVRIRFITSNSARGDKGFQISWTELLPQPQAKKCHGFQCQLNKHCISSVLKCNGEPNCGVGDTSDEKYDCPVTKKLNVYHVLLVTGLMLVLIGAIFICICTQRKKIFRKKTAEDEQNDSNFQFIQSSARSDDLSTTTRSTPLSMREQTNKISMV